MTARVSSVGRVQTCFGIITWGHQAVDGYFYVRIAGQQYSVHSLVAQAFHGSKAEGVFQQIHHEDGNKSNNTIGNLKYTTPREILQLSYARGRRTRARPIEARAVGVHTWTLFASQSDAAHKLGLFPSSISACCRKRMRQTGGYEFRFAPDGSPLEFAICEGFLKEEWREVILPPRLRTFSNRNSNCT